MGGSGAPIQFQMDVLVVRTNTAEHQDGAAWYERTAHQALDRFGELRQRVRAWRQEVHHPGQGIAAWSADRSRVSGGRGGRGRAGR